MQKQYTTYYEYGDGIYSNIMCYTTNKKCAAESIKYNFFNDVAAAIASMEKGTGYDITRVVFDGESLKWHVTDIEFCASVLVTFTNSHTGRVVHSVSAPW